MSMDDILIRERDGISASLEDRREESRKTKDYGRVLPHELDERIEEHLSNLKPDSPLFRAEDNSRLIKDKGNRDTSDPRITASDEQDKLLTYNTGPDDPRIQAGEDEDEDLDHKFLSYGGSK